jgi:leader peptidase (prepilin peptidase)/N-methyltransferase
MDYPGTIGALIVGLASGMVVNYFSDVLPKYRKLGQPECDSCNKPLQWTVYLLWWKRCSECGHLRGWRTWAVLAVYILFAIWNWNSPSDKLGFTISMLLLVYFGVVAVIDLEHRVILHPVSLAGVLMGIFIGMRMHGLWATLIGGLVGFSIMLLFYYLGILYVRLRLKGSSEVEEGDALGFGDVNLSAVVGLVLGWPGVITGLVLAIVLAGIVSLVYIMLLLLQRKFHPNLAIAYGPYLILSAVFLIFFKDTIL